MAKSRRTPTRRSRKQRTPMDWVYRNDLYDEAGAPLDQNGTYVPNIAKAHTAGFAAGSVMWLYDSDNMVSRVEDISGVATPTGAWRRSEGKRPTIVRVQGSIQLEPATWALGTTYRVGLRFGVFKQNSLTGLAILDANYSMWGNGNAVQQQQQPARFANERNWVREFRLAVQFNDNNRFLNLFYNFKVNRTLRHADDAFGVYIETISGSVTLNGLWLLRSLVSDSGS